MNGFSKAQKIAISARDLDCVIHGAGGVCVGDLTHHHRKGRGAGGVKSRNRVANGLLVCGQWNGMVESDAATASKARSFGWKLRTDHEIDTIPVYIPKLGRHVYLDDDGHYLDLSHNIITSQEAA